MTLSLANHRKSDFDRFEHYIHDLDEVIECIATGGGTDFIMKVVTRNLASFQILMDTILSAELGIDHYMTYIVTRDIKFSQPNLSKLIPNKDS